LSKTVSAKVENYCKEIIQLVDSGKISSREELALQKIRLCKKHGLASMPSNPEILLFAKKKSKKLLSLLKIKPMRTLSGVAVCAIMTKPHECPGNCIYCPSSLAGSPTPKSYTGKEPAAMRALMHNFSPSAQVKNRLQQLEEAGHKVNKLELIVMGGTFFSQPLPFQKKFMISALNAISSSRAKTLEGAKKAAETSRVRVVGITFETRPDFAGKKEISRMLDFGGTRCELGVQNPSNEIYNRINRGHSVEEVVSATQLLKDSCFKVSYHLMPGLPGSSPKQDLEMFKEIFSNPQFKPDMLKIYPTLVIEGTRLFKQWKQGKYKPLSSKKAAELVAKMKKFVPRWVRIMRVQRDIPSPLISAGVKKSNLRQLVEEELSKQGIQCNCIRCREVGLKTYLNGNTPIVSKAKLFVEEYDASNGSEFFISFEDKGRNHLFGFCRLRIPFKPFRKEISPSTALVRELHVFGEALPLGRTAVESAQHQGFGKKLLQKAEEIASKEFGSSKLLVISGLGAKPYYRALGFKNDGVFVSKKNLNP